MGAKSRRKGHTFERDICKILNKHFSIDSWKRVPLSGGFDKKHFPGDVYNMDSPTTSSGKFGRHFSIECKFHKDWNLDNIINGNHCKILDWWSQASTDAKIGNKRPLLVFKKNLSKIFFMASEYDLQLQLGIMPENWFITRIFPGLGINAGEECVRIGMFMELLSTITQSITYRM